MLDSILQKNVSVVVANGSMIIGFVSEMDEEFIKVVEQDNSQTIIRKCDVSYINISSGVHLQYNKSPTSAENDYHVKYGGDENQYVLPHQQATQQRPTRTYVVKHGSDVQEYSMNNPVNTGVSGPKFERKT